MKLSSEKRFNIAEQPSNICPSIDGLLDSISNIDFCEANDESIDVDADWSSWSSVKSEVDDLRHWQQEWIDIGEQITEKLYDINKAIERSDNEEDLSSEEEIYVSLFYYEHEEIKTLKIEIEEHLEDWKKTLKSDFYDLEREHSAVISSIEGYNESASSDVESFRGLVSDFRTNGNHFKELIRDNAFEYLPELCDDPTFEEIYEKKQEDKALNSFVDLKEKELNSNPKKKPLNKKNTIII